MKYFATLIATVLLTACGTPWPDAVADYAVIPLPKNIETNEDEAEQFVLCGKTHIVVAADCKENADMVRNASFLKDYISQQLGESLVIDCGKETACANQILLNLTDAKVGESMNDVLTGEEREEGYSIVINKNKVTIEAASPAGVFYGIQTLRKAIAMEKGAIRLPAGQITDEPRFKYRGLHFDVARHFFPIDSVKAVIDMMALHNMNHLHWHITDDQGWRLEIKKYPLLTEVGGTRCGTMIAKDFDSCDSIPYGGWMTQEEARDVVRYAAERYITVIPEVDMPGHMVAAVTAYPELGCTGGPYEVMTKWGISDDLLCAGNEKVYEFVEGVLDEIMDVFPSKDIHIGGDECPKIRWENCPKCQKLIKELGLKNDSRFTKEQKLQSHFTHHVDTYLTAHGRTCIGWDEILEGGISDNATVMSWRGEEGGIEATSLGHRVIMVPTSHFYFDYYQTPHRDTEPLAIGSYIPVKKVYDYDPMPTAIPAEQQHLVWGIQANLWTEYISTFSHVQYMYLPRVAALAESQWAEHSAKDYTLFKNERLPRLMKLYDLCGFNYSRRIFTDTDEDVEMRMPW